MRKDRLPKDWYEPNEAAEVLSDLTGRRIGSTWVREKMIRGANHRVAAREHIAAPERAVRLIESYIVDGNYGSPKACDFLRWIVDPEVRRTGADVERHKQYSLQSTRAVVPSTNQATESNASTRRSDASLLAEIQDLKHRVLLLEQSKTKNQHPAPSGLLQSFSDSPERKKARHVVASWLVVQYEQPDSDDYRITWIWLRRTFESAVGGVEADVYREQLENGSWLAAIERAGHIDLFLELLPRMLAKRTAELDGVAQPELF